MVNKFLPFNFFVVWEGLLKNALFRIKECQVLSESTESMIASYNSFGSSYYPFSSLEISKGS